MVVNSVTYNKLPFLSKEGTQHLIFFNGDDDQGDDDVRRGRVDIAANADTYVKVVSGAAEVVDPNSYTTGVASLKSAKTAAGVRYNLAGQKVNNGYKGVVIIDGKKFFVQ